MKHRISYIVGFFFTFIPEFFSNKVYQFFFFFLRRVLFNDYNLLLRNSIFCHYCVFGKSDLDFTFYFKSKPNQQDINSLKKKLERAKLIFPLCGESEILTDHDIEEFSFLCNELEKRRHPLLRSFSKEKASPAEKLCFLMRGLLSDQRNLDDDQTERLRLRKWRYHFRELDLAELDEKAPLKGQIEKKLKSHGIENIELLSSPSILVGRWRSCLDHGESFKGVAFSQLEKEVLIEQFHWEFWGMVGQFRLIENSKEFIVHLEYFKSLLEHWDIEVSSKTKEAFLKLQEIESSSRSLDT